MTKNNDHLPDDGKTMSDIDELKAYLHQNGMCESFWTNGKGCGETIEKVAFFITDLISKARSEGYQAGLLRAAEIAEELKRHFWTLFKNGNPKLSKGNFYVEGQSDGASHVEKAIRQAAEKGGTEMKQQTRYRYEESLNELQREVERLEIYESTLKVIFGMYYKKMPKCF